MKIPRYPTDLTGRSWWRVVKRTAVEFKNDRVQDLAASLTYYAVLSIFPALIVLVSLLGFFGQQHASTLFGSVVTLAPAEVQDLLTQGLRGVQEANRPGLAAIVGLVVALWSSSGYIAAFIRACNQIYDIDEGRPFYKLTPLRVGLTVMLMLLMAAAAVAVTLTGDLSRVAGEALGLGDTTVTVWNVAKWPVLAVIAVGLILVLYWAAPNVRQPGVHWLTPGGLLAVVLWLIVSTGFAVYVANFGSYNKTYGTLATVVVFLVWLWLSNMALLFGAELDAELIRERRVAAGEPVEREPYADPRDPPKPDSLPG
ncbi:YihY/virulence factor BrkB family protein [Nonomuraea sp. MCN248]|uniref:YihY/virulence factor BrkB family protein n=1 Tax=Nonomuraea corallina TaxID=2989783 RepID=A0ABT4S7H6_9ACTN|nr:YihY/virulence factor BrkB family protein [Nonomuraea corallina]MDA0633126.1 YihY/virulence factor BrkB family protein [Nonomuraea corallina]